MQISNKEKPLEKIQEAAQSAASAKAAPSRERKTRTVLFQAGLVGAAIAFVVLTFFAKSTAYFPVDLKITHTLQTINNPIFSKAMSWISWAGFFPQTILIVSLIVGLLYFYGFHWEAIMGVFVAAFELAVNALVKAGVHRLRPSASLVHVVAALNSFSFPSGHVMFYTAFFGFNWFLAYTLLKKSALRTSLLIVFGVLILFVGISRVYLGEHWASDVVGAYALGILVLAVMIQTYRWGKPRFFTHQPTAPERE